MFFSGIYFAAGGRFTLVICPAGTDPEGQSDGMNMNIILTNHDLQGCGPRMNSIIALGPVNARAALIRPTTARDLARQSASHRKVMPVQLLWPASTPVGRLITAHSVPPTG